MRERPILFNAEMVRAVLDGRKTQTRRIMSPQPADDIQPHKFPNKALLGWLSSLEHKHGSFTAHICPFGQPGDRLWVRETWADVNHDGCPAVAYRADGEVRDLNEDDGEEDDPNLEKYWFANWYPDLISGTEGRWTPSIHMPRWASRITLEITGVRVEWLASISSDDARAEGYPADRAADGGNSDPWLWFRDLWDGIYPEQSFKANPWVWIVEFKRVEGDQ